MLTMNTQKKIITMHGRCASSLCSLSHGHCASDHCRWVCLWHPPDGKPCLLASALVSLPLPEEPIGVGHWQCCIVNELTPSRWLWQWTVHGHETVQGAKSTTMHSSLCQLLRQCPMQMVAVHMIITAQCPMPGDHQCPTLLHCPVHAHQCPMPLHSM